MTIQAADATDDLQASTPAAPDVPTSTSQAPSTGAVPPPAPGGVGAVFHPALPAIGVLAVLLVVAILVVRRMSRMPRDHPMRGAAMGFSALVAAVLGVLLLLEATPAGGALLTRGHAAYAEYLRERPADPLESYVPLYPGATPAQLVPSTQRWEASTSAPISAVAAFYQATDHHAGWKVELSAASGVVLMRHATGGEERLRIQAFRTKAQTRIEYELRRHIP